MAVQRKIKSSRLAQPSNELQKRTRGYWRSSFAQEDVPARLLFLLQPLQKLEFSGAKGMYAIDSVFQATAMQGPGLEVDIVPSEPHQFPGPKCVLETEQDPRSGACEGCSGG